MNKKHGWLLVLVAVISVASVSYGQGTLKLGVAVRSVESPATPARGATVDVRVRRSGYFKSIPLLSPDGNWTVVEIPVETWPVVVEVSVPEFENYVQQTVKLSVSYPVNSKSVVAGENITLYLIDKTIEPRNADYQKFEDERYAHKQLSYEYFRYMDATVFANRAQNEMDRGLAFIRLEYLLTSENVCVYNSYDTCSAALAGLQDLKNQPRILGQLKASELKSVSEAIADIKTYTFNTNEVVPREQRYQRAVSLASSGRDALALNAFQAILTEYVRQGTLWEKQLATPLWRVLQGAGDSAIRLGSEASECQVSAFLLQQGMSYLESARSSPDIDGHSSDLLAKSIRDAQTRYAELTCD